MRRGLALLLLVTGCSCGAGTSAGPGSGPDAPDVTPFTEWSVPGLTLTRRCYAVPDQSTCAVVGATADGSEVGGRALWSRIASDASLAADDLARRAIAVLLGEAGSEPLGPESDRSLWGSFVSDAEWAIVQAPARENDWVVFDFVEGEMSPQANRIRVHLASGTVERAPLAELASLRAEASGAVLCAPALTCGCDRGCVRFEPVPAVRGGERFREVGGDPPALYYRTRAGWMALAGAEECGESCPEPQTAPPYACALEGERCAAAR